MSVTFFQIMQFHAIRETRTCSQEIGKIVYPERIAKKTVENWNNVLFPIPNVISTSNGFCRIITISYSAILNFDASGIALSKYSLFFCELS
jgi:hypothetical protein